MDRRKNNGGHSTKGKAGRKPKAQEIKIAEALDRVADLDSVLAALYQKVLDNDTAAIKLWLSYRIGMPTQNTDITSNGETLNTNFTPMSFVESKDDRDK